VGVLTAGVAVGRLLPDPLPAHSPAPPVVHRCRASPRIIEPGNQPALDADQELGRQVANLELIDRAMAWTNELRECAHDLSTRQPPPVVTFTVARNGEVKATNVAGEAASTQLLLCAQHLAREWWFRASPTEFRLELPVEDCRRD
jgi:hypothetical protein